MFETIVGTISGSLEVASINVELTANCNLFSQGSVIYHLIMSIESHFCKFSPNMNVIKVCFED